MFKISIDVCNNGTFIPIVNIDNGISELLTAEEVAEAIAGAIKTHSSFVVTAV